METKDTWARPGSRLQVTAVFAVALGVLIVLAVIAFRAVDGLRIANRELGEAYEARTATRQVLLALTDLEMRSRGYLIMGDSAVLPNYERALRNLDTQLIRLNSLVEEDTALSERVLRFASIAHVQVDSVRKAVEIRQTSGFDAARAFILRNRDKQLYEATDAAALSIMRAVDDRQARQRLRAYRHGVRASLNIGLLTISAIGLLLLVYVYVRRDVQKREQVAQALASMNVELERRVRIRTEELTASNTRLELAVEELQRMNRELRDFYFAASHHFKEPLRKIVMFSGLLEDEYAASVMGRGKDYTDRIDSAAKRLLQLITDYMEYTRAWAQDLSFQKVDLSRVVQSALRHQDMEALHPPPVVELGPLPVVYADARQMELLFEQLIDNAVKFRHPERALHLCIEGELQPSNNGDSSFAVITVADNGIGFDEKYLDRVFTPFQRLHHREGYEGTGIGLALCRRIVEHHHGTITVRSTPDKGTVFTVTLPVVHPSDRSHEYESVREREERAAS